MVRSCQVFFCKPHNHLYSTSVHPAKWRTLRQYSSNLDNLFLGVPYDCDSIMHFGTETFSLGRPTMEARDSSCDLRCMQWNDFTGKVQLTFANRWVGAAFDGRHGSSIASPWDWELLKRIAARLCPAASSTNSRRPTSGGNQRRPRKQGRGKRHSTEWNISLQQF